MSTSAKVKGKKQRKLELIKQSLAFPFVEPKPEAFTAESLTRLARANGSSVADVALWLMQGKSVYTDFSIYRLSIDGDTAKATGAGQ